MNVVEIIFSPTGGTEKAAHIIGEHWSKDTVRIDLCDKKIDFSKCNIAKDDMVLIAMPSFGGRTPAVAIERLKQIRGNGGRCKRMRISGYCCHCCSGGALHHITVCLRQTGFV